MLFREALGEVLREARLAKGMTLRQASAKGCMALGYLSEIERCQKELSSEPLRSLTNGLGIPTHEVVFKAGLRMAGLDVPDTAEGLLERIEEYADLVPQN